MSSPTVENLYLFHAQDREIFSKLVIKFSRPPVESLLVMATWFWLEDFGFENIFSIILAFPDSLILALAKEAVSCFTCLESANLPVGSNQIPLTAEHMKKNISLQIIYKHKYTAITGIKNFLNTICSKIFTDILQSVLPYSSSSSLFTGFRYPLIIPGFPHRTFGNINVIPNVVDEDILPNNNLYLFPNDLWGWNATSISSESERTIFLTFSRGFPVSQAEVKEIFTRNYGENCVEGIHMQVDNTNISNTSSNINGQSLYARLVLDSVVTVDRILKGQKLEKFRIRGKHIWARKYESMMRRMPT